MKRILLIFLIMILMSNLLFSNPIAAKPSPNKGIYIVLAVATLGIGLLIYNILTPKRDVSFDDETINITIGEFSEVKVHGFYNFSRTRNFDKQYEILYPFPEQEVFGKVDVEFIKVNGSLIDFQQDELDTQDRLIFDLVFDNSGNSTLEISFTQNPITSEYKYILLSTREWKEELDECEINLFFPTHVNVDLNYQDLEESFDEAQNLSCLSLLEKDFMPEKDFVFGWN